MKLIIIISYFYNKAQEKLSLKMEKLIQTPNVEFHLELPLSLIITNERAISYQKTHLSSLREDKSFKAIINNELIELTKIETNKKTGKKTNMSLKTIQVKDIIGFNIDYNIINLNDNPDINDIKAAVSKKKKKGKSNSTDNIDFLKELKEYVTVNAEDEDSIIYIILDINYLAYFKAKCCSSCCCCCRYTEEDRYLQNLKLVFSLERDDIKGSFKILNDIVSKLVLIMKLDKKEEFNNNNNSDNNNNNTDNEAFNSNAFSHLIINSRGILLPIVKKKLLVFVNPIGGQGKAVKTWESVKDIFVNNKSFVEVEVFYTEYYRHAYDHTLKINKDDYQGIICCSGDGIVHEVVNAISYKIKEEGWHHSDIPIGVLPAGTSNALAKTIAIEGGDKYLTTNLMVYYILRGNTKRIDIHEIEFLNSKKKVYSFLSVCYAITADIDLESEL